MLPSGYFSSYAAQALTSATVLFIFTTDMEQINKKCYGLFVFTTNANYICKEYYKYVLNRPVLPARTPHCITTYSYHNFRTAKQLTAYEYCMYQPAAGSQVVYTHAGHGAPGHYPAAL